MAIPTVIVALLMGALAFLGLLLASRAADATIYCTGFALFAFGVLMIFGLIARTTSDRKKN